MFHYMYPYFLLQFLVLLQWFEKIHPLKKDKIHSYFLQGFVFNISKFNLSLLLPFCLSLNYWLPFYMCSTGWFPPGSQRSPLQCEWTDCRGNRSGRRAEKVAVGPISQPSWCSRTDLTAAVFHQTSAQHIDFLLI